MEEKAYFLCSYLVIEQFPEVEKSTPFKSGYDFEKDKVYYVAVLDFDAVDKHYKENIEPFDNLIEFWCRECVPGSMDVSNITLSAMKKNGIFVEFENKLNLTTERNRAMIIYNLAQKYNCTPIEFINKITHGRKSD